MSNSVRNNANILVDSHCHLNFPELKSRLDEVMQNASNNNVAYMQTICTKMQDFPEIVTIAESYPNIWCSVGIHPNNVAGEPPVSAETLATMAQHPKVIGFGETGLDFYYEKSAKEQQIASFIEHIKAARITGLPLIVHTRDADKETIEILQDEFKKGAFTGLIHCFSTGKELALAAIELGFYISISGIVTFKNAVNLQEIVKDLPLEKLLVETDAPYLAPMPFRGKVNEPAYTKHTAQFIANLKNVEISEVMQKTTGNFFDLFHKAIIY